MHIDTKVARFLESAPGICRVHYPGLKSNAGFGVQQRQARGPGQLVSFETGSDELSRLLCEEINLFRLAVSFGSTGSTISMPCHMSHASVPDSAIEEGRAVALPSDLVRLSVGLEDARDLIGDLQRVLGLARNPRRDNSGAAWTEEPGRVGSKP